MENKSLVRKRVVKIDGSEPLVSQVDILLGETPIGRVGTVFGTQGLAMVRLDRASDALDKPAKLTANGIEITVAPDAIEKYRTAAAARGSSPGLP